MCAYGANCEKNPQQEQEYVCTFANTTFKDSTHANTDTASRAARTHSSIKKQYA